MQSGMHASQRVDSPAAQRRPLSGAGLRVVLPVVPGRFPSYSCSAMIALSLAVCLSTPLTWTAGHDGDGEGTSAAVEGKEKSKKTKVKQKHRDRENPIGGLSANC